LERLECREVPAANVALQGQMLVITGDGANDTVFISEASGQLFVNVNGQIQAPLARTAVQLISFDGGGGNDIFVNTTSAFAIALGGTGADILVGGSGGNFLLGGSGNDVLVGGVGNDTIVGDTGNDIVFGGPGVDIVFGGSGRDIRMDDDRLHDAFDDRGTDPFDAVDDRGNDINDAPDDSDGRDDRGGNSGPG
jgi:Ca2+-binding RTX toxin-like protein